MRLLDQLRSLGTKLGILHLEKPRDTHTPTKIMMRTISISELEVEVVTTPTSQEQPGLTDNFTTICAAHGITMPAHGWTIERLAHESRLTGFSSSDRTAVQIALLERLHADGVPVEEVVRDAIARDQAVDAYAAAMRKRLIARARDRLHRRLLIQQEMERLANEQQILKADEATDAEIWRLWWNRKLENEHAMAFAVSYLLEKSIISIDAHVPSIEVSATSPDQ